MTQPELSIFTHNLGLGGAQRVIVNLVGELDARNYDIEIVLVDKRGELLEQVPESVSVVELDANPFIGTVLELRRYLEETRPEVLLSTVNTANLMAILATKTTGTGTKHVVRMANTPSKKAQEYDERWTDRAIPYLMKILYPLANEVITISEGLTDDLVTNYRVSRDKTTVIYNPCVTEEILQKGGSHPDCEWFTDPKTKVVLGVGSLSEQKDFQTLVRAFSTVYERDNSTRLVILGEGTRRTHLERLCKETGVEDVVRLPGEVSNPYPYFANADVFVLSSRWEGFGVVTVEAMAFGTPVVATDCPHGPSEILGEGQYGRLVPVGDAGKLSTAIDRTLSDLPDPDRLKRRARRFSIETIADEYESVLFNVPSEQPHVP